MRNFWFNLNRLVPIFGFSVASSYANDALSGESRWNILGCAIFLLISVHNFGQNGFNLRDHYTKGALALAIVAGFFTSLWQVALAYYVFLGAAWLLWDRATDRIDGFPRTHVQRRATRVEIVIDPTDSPSVVDSKVYQAFNHKGEVTLVFKEGVDIAQIISDYTDQP